MDQRTLLAITLSLLLVVIYQTTMDFYFPPPEVAIVAPVEGEKTETSKSPKDATVPGTSNLEKMAPIPVAQTQPALPESVPGLLDETKEPFAQFKTALLEGKISLKGASFSDLRFLKHLTHLPPGGQPIRFLDRHSRDFFFNESGFLSPQGNVPDRTTVWNLAKSDSADTNRSVRLFWDNGRGLLFEKIITVDEKTYLFTVEDRVVNSAENPVEVNHFSHFIRTEPVIDSHAMAVSDFQGPMGFLDGSRVSHAYEDLRKKDIHESASRGWVGFSDKYFLAAMISTDDKAKRFYFDFDSPSHRVGTVSERQVVAPKNQLSHTLLLYIGPKEINTLEKIGHDLERSIDYGWFHFLAVPLVELLLVFYSFFHNFGLAIILLTLIIKIIFFPLANKSYRSMNEMKKLQPKVEELRKRFLDDKQRMNQEMMKLYQDNKVNPLGGCLPIVVQIPVFFALYKVLFLSIEMRHAPFIFWIQDLSEQDPFYVLPVLMGISMFLQSKLNPTPADPIQAKIMMFLPIIFTFLFLSFPSGLVLYWLVNNILSILQQSYIVKKS